MDGKEIHPNHKDLWVNIVDFLQHYWAVIEKDKDGRQVIVHLLRHDNEVLESMKFEHEEKAKRALLRNGFKHFNDPLEDFRSFLRPPDAPTHLINGKGGTRVT